MQRLFPKICGTKFKTDGFHLNLESANYLQNTGPSLRKRRAQARRQRAIGAGAVSQNGKSPGLDAGAPPSSRRRCRAALSDAIVYPGLHFVGNPRDATLAQLYPLWEVACQFESGDMLKRVRDTEQTFQLFLAHQFRVGHRQSLVKGSVDAPLQNQRGRENPKSIAEVVNSPEQGR